MARSWRLPRPRFSLSTLLLGVIFICACGGLWYRWEPWGCSVVLNGLSAGMYQPCFSPDGRQCATKGEDWVRIWDVDSGRETIFLNIKGVIDTCFSPDGKKVVVTCRDGTARVHDVKDGQELAVLRGHGGYVLSAVFLPSGREVITCSRDGTARKWNVLSGAQIDTSMMHPTAVARVVPTQDGRLLATSCDMTNGDTFLWDATTCQRVAVVPGYFAAFSVDSQRVATMSDDKVLRWWDVASGKEVSGIILPEPSTCSPFMGGNGQRLLDVDHFRKGTVRDQSTGRDVATLDVPVSLWMFSLDGRRILTTGPDGNAYVWDADSGCRLATLRGHSRFLMAARFCTQSTRIMTQCAEDETVQVWTRRRPEWVWGFVALPEFWLALISGTALLLLAARRTRRRFARPTAVPPQQPVADSQ